MDQCAPVRNDGISPAKRMPSSDCRLPVSVLLISRDEATRLYTDDVLRHAGFGVRSIAPWEVDRVVGDGIQAFSLVVFSNTLNSEDISRIAIPLRQHSPHSRLLLLLGPDSMPANLSLFDAILEGLEGPAALVQAVRRLAQSTDGPAIMSA